MKRENYFILVLSFDRRSLLLFLGVQMERGGEGVGDGSVRTKPSASVGSNVSKVVSDVDLAHQEAYKKSTPASENEAKARMGYATALNAKAASSSKSGKIKHEMSKELDEVLKGHMDKEEPAIKQSYEFIRLRTKKFMATSIVGFVWDVSFLVLSCISCFAFIRSTYLPPHPTDILQKSTKEQLEIFELVSSALFGFDWGLNYFVADDKNEFVGSFYSMVDLLSVIPTYILYGAARDAPYESEIDSLGDFLWYFCHAATCARILRVLRIRKYLLHVKDEVQQKIGEIILVSLVTLIFFAALMQFFERTKQEDPNERDGYDFNVWLYVMLVTTSTVGYGDFSPETEMGKGSVMFMIIFVVMGLPMMTTDLFEKMRYSSFWARLSYNKIANGTHVVVCGDLRSVSLNEFFNELFHEDHNNENLYAVVLSGEPPWREMLNIMRNPKFTLNLTFLEGSALIDEDLARAHVESATAIFIMANKFTPDPDQEDARAILQQYSIKRYIAMKKPKQPPKFQMQLIRVENLRHLRSGQDDEFAKDDVVVCLNQIKMGIVATNILYPGTSIMIFNLLMSFADGSDDDDDDDDDDYGKENADGVEELNEDSVNGWLDEYISGCDWEIYTTVISPDFSGARFSTLAYLLYVRLGITLFGLQLTDLKGDKHVLLNPDKFDIPKLESEFTKIEGFVLAKNQGAADLSEVGGDTSDKSSVSHGSKEQSRRAMLYVICQTLAVDRRKGSRKRGQGGVQSILAGMQTNRGSIFPVGAVVDTVGVRSASPLSFGEAKAEDTDNLIGASRGEEVPENQSAGDEETRLESANWMELRRTIRKHDAATQQQERLLNLENSHMLEHYYCREEIVDLNRVTILTSLENEFPEVTQHLIIISKVMSNLYDLILPLRARRNKRLITIVIMSPNPMPERVWQQISQFEGILFICGSTLQESDLIRAGVFKAKHVVLLADIGYSKESSDKDSSSHTYTEIENDVTVDADAIFTYQSVRRLNEDADITVEIVGDNNIMFLDTSESAVHFKASPQFAAGNIFISSLLDTMSVQSFYNQDIIKIVEHLAVGSDAHLSTVEDYENIQAEKQGKRRTFPSSRLYEIGIPEGLSSMTYGALFHTLVKRGQIPLGIIRGVFKSRQFGSRGNKLRYAFTNPPKDAELFSCDSVVILSSKPPNSTPAMEKALRRDVEMAKSAVKQGGVNIMKFVDRDMKLFAEMQGDLDKSLTSAIKAMKRDAPKQDSSFSGLAYSASQASRRMNINARMSINS